MYSAMIFAVTSDTASPVRLDASSALLTRTISSNRKPRVAVLRQEGSNGDREMAAAFWRAGFEAWDVTMTDLIDGCVRNECGNCCVCSLDLFAGGLLIQANPATLSLTANQIALFSNIPHHCM